MRETVMPLRSLCTAVLGFLTLALGVSQAHAQLEFQWDWYGPNNVGGRTRALQFMPNGDLYAGSAGGGLWINRAGTQSWQEVNAYNYGVDNQTINQCISSLAYDEANNVLFVGTGDLPYHFESQASLESLNDPTIANYKGQSGCFGTGIYVSTDGGQSFTLGQGTWTGNLNRFDATATWASVPDLAVRNGRCFAATLEGVYYSDDNWATATKASTTAETGSDPVLDDVMVYDLELGEGNRLYATTGLGLFISEDNGETFTQYVAEADFPRNQNDPNAITSRARIEVAVSPSNPSVVYVAEVNGNGFLMGVWRSPDNGQTWSQVGPRATSLSPQAPGNSAFIPLQDWVFGGAGQGINSIVLSVDPEDEDRLYLGGQRFYIYTPDSGWVNYNTRVIPRFPNDPTFVPAYQNVMAFDPTQPGRIVVGSESAIVRSADAGRNWRFFFAGYGAAKIYSVAPTNDGSLYMLNSNVGVGYTDKPGQLRDFNFGTNFSEGIGLLRASYYNPEHLLQTRRDGDLRRSINGGDNFETFYGFPDQGTQCTGSADDTIVNSATVPGQMDFTPMFVNEVLKTTQVIDSTGRDINPTFLYMARGSYVWAVRNPYGGTDSLPTWTKLNCTPFQGTITALSATPNDTDQDLFVSTTRGEIFRINNAHDLANATVDNITPTNAPTHWISDLAVSPHNPDLLIVTYGSYLRQGAANNQRVGIAYNAQGNRLTFDANSNLALPASLPIYKVMFHPLEDSGWVLLGTEVGLYYRPSAYGSLPWIPIEDDRFPRVPVFDLNSNFLTLRDLPGEGPARAVDFNTDGRVYVATWGHGIYASRMGILDPNSIREAEPKGVEPATVFPNPAQGRATLRLPVTTGNVSLTLTDPSGKAVAGYHNAPYTVPASGELQLDLATLPAGLYLVQAEWTTPGQAPRRFATRLVVR